MDLDCVIAALRINDCPHMPTRVFPAYFVLTRTFLEKTSQEVTHPEITPDQACLTSELI